METGFPHNELGVEVYMHSREYDVAVGHEQLEEVHVRLEPLAFEV